MSYTVILANGSFPKHCVPLDYLRNADRIICCDGSTENAVYAGFTPFAIVGDMDSLSREMKIRFSDRIFQDKEQETNDLTKAVKWCHGSGYNEVIILGATGKREDHTIGNISLLTEYAKIVNVRMVTDTGIFLPFLNSCRVDSFPGQQISVFSIDSGTQITSAGLRYPLTKKRMGNWWEATLNEALEDHITLEFDSGRVIVFLAYED
ncbi:MAG TPA: thiamine diphosphokinase [Bacteroidales bacterium]|nr:thiamine diphosphokinase [Bacteroidales bacterium]